jgi:glycosyltransferase involved in cell wall biosynthesis
MPGRTSQAEAALREAAIFVLSSRYEGFPNALLEAMACGCAVVSFDCPSGPAELINNEVNGMLVAPEDADALATVMRRLINDAELRRRLGAGAETVRERFALPRIAGHWMQVMCND